MFTVILFAILMFLSLVEWVIFIDVILSWAIFIGFNIRPRWVASIADPLYESIRNLLPTSFGPVDFTPIIIVLGIELLSRIIVFIDPNVLALLAIR